MPFTTIKVGKGEFVLNAVFQPLLYDDPAGFFRLSAGYKVIMQ
jgi:hypothetical protein